MFKKIIGITILIGLVAVLIFGAINRTQAKAAQGDRFNQAGAGYSRGNGGGDPALGNPQAEVDEWINLEGEVTAVDTTLLTITLADGQVIEVYGRPRSYAQENGFSLQVGDRVLLTGFYEGATLEVGAIQNLATGSSIQIREENGRPLWAGRGRQG